MRPTRSRRTAAALVALAMATGLLAGVGAAPASGAAAPVIGTETFGTSVEGRHIKVVHRAHEGATRRVLVVGNIHGDEQAGLRVVKELLRREGLPRELDLWLARTVNPDGTADDRRTNAHGVDLNRNFPYRWHSGARGPTWSGPAPMSEPESVALRTMVRKLKPWLVVIFHQPLYGVGANDKGMPTVRALAAGMRLPVREFHCTGVCYGTFAGWVNHRTDSLAVTVEFGRSASDAMIARAARTVVRVGSGT